MKNADKAGLYRELAKLTGADFHLDRSLSLLLGQKKPPAVHEWLEHLRQGLAAGRGVAEAVRGFPPGLAADMEAALIEAGERSGRLAQAFTHLACYFASAAEAARMVEADGFTAVKFDPAGAYSIHGGRQPSVADLDRSEAFCRAMRAAVGDRADLLFGTHGQFTTAGAIRLARRIEKIETALEPRFQTHFVDAMAFPNRVDAFPELAKAVALPRRNDASDDAGPRRRRRTALRE